VLRITQYRRQYPQFRIPTQLKTPSTLKAKKMLV
jgi:hypothetical protein